MKRRTPGGIWALRAVTIAIALVVVIVLGTVAYSAYKDYTGVKSELSAGSGGATGKAVLQGTSEVISINITVPNNGLYTLNVTVTCDPTNTNVACQRSQVSVPAGQQQVLHFQMTIVNVAQFVASSDHRINGTVSITLEPFAGLTIGVDLGGYVQNPGGP